MAMIKGPAHRDDYADRSLDCQQALEPMFLELVRTADTPYLDLSNMAGPIFEAAEAAGWTIDDVATAICELAVNFQLGERVNRATDAAIAKAIADRLKH
jgi:hypothetical protein